MRKGLLYIATSLLYLSTLSPASAQNEVAIKLQSRATKQSIRLRWAPNTPTVWHFANKYGYTIERITIAVNGQIQQNPVRTILTQTPIKPARQENWEAYIDSDDYVAISAQAIFGETFELSNNYVSDVVKVINKAEELESRFSFALFSADQSIKAAELSGLYFEDETVAGGTKYLYRIYANIPENIVKVDTGFVYTGLQDYVPLPKVRDVKAEFDDHMALISWDGALMHQTYNSFWVERSDDNGKTFHKTTDKPVINTYSGDKPRSKMIFKMDTLPSNDKTYYYRVLGINAFGEIGPPSDTASGSGRPKFDYTATISAHTITKEGDVILEWTFPSSGEPLLHSFDLLRLNLSTKATENVVKKIDKATRSITDTLPKSSNYYIVRVNDRYGRSTNSFPYLVQLEDSIPPSAPLDLTGRIDTLGRVFLNWKANAEEDMEGYHLYKSNFNSDEFIQIPGPIVKQNTYIDTIKLNNLTDKIYYKIQAVDKRFNRSEFSETLTLKKPDILPPVSPVFKSIKSDSLGIQLQWFKSDSEDVVEHLLYRRTENEAEWTLIKTIDITDTVNTFLDKDVEHQVSYAYTLLAVDDARLESNPCEPLSMRWISATPHPQIQEVFHSLDKTKKTVTVSWQYSQNDIDKFLIYKAINGQPLKLYKAMDGITRELKDSFGVSDTEVEYRIVAMFKNGERTKFSKALTIKI